MPCVKITPGALAAIESPRELPDPENDPHPLRRRPGSYKVWFDEVVIQHLNAKAFKGETISDTIIRLATLNAAGGRFN